MTITYWTNFSKRKNSTKRPSSGTDLTVVLKNGTSLENPTFILNDANAFNITYVKAFDHYYFVSDVRQIHKDIVEVDCVQDVLATYKSAIGGYTCMIERAASDYNTLLPDPMCAMHNDVFLLNDTSGMTSFFNASGYYVLTVLNNIGSGAGFTCYYLMTAATLMDIAAYVNVDWLDDPTITDITDALKATFLKTADAIVECHWVPLALSSTFGSYEDVKIGVQTLSGVKAYRVTAATFTKLEPTLTIQHFYNDFRKGSPYTSVKLFIPYFGMVDVNPLDFYDNKVTVSYAVDVTTGDAFVRLLDSTAHLVSTYTFNVATNCPVARVSGDFKGTMSGVLSTAGGVAKYLGASSGGERIAGALSATAGAINTVAAAMGPTMSYSGSQGGRAMSLYVDLQLVSIIKKTSAPLDYIATNGMPLMESRQISALSGYVQCANASISINGPDMDRDAINSYLNSGFYYE